MVVFYFAEIYLDYYLPEKNGVNLLTSQHKSPDHLVPSNCVKVHHLLKRHSWKWKYNPFSIFMLYEDNESNLWLWFFNIHNVYHNVKGAVTNLLPWYVKLKCLQMFILSSFSSWPRRNFVTRLRLRLCVSNSNVCKCSSYLAQRYAIKYTYYLVYLKFALVP